MIIELSDKVPGEPGRYFGRYKAGHIGLFEITKASGSEYWQFDRKYDDKYYGLCFERGPLSEAQVSEWSEKIQFRATME